MLALNSTAGSGQVLAVNGILNYGTNDVCGKPAIIHTSGTAPFYLVYPGTYHITATVNLTATTTTANELALYNNGTIITTSTATAGTADDVVSFVLDKIVRVAPSCMAVNNQGVITVGVVAGGGAVVSANMAIEKIV